MTEPSPTTDVSGSYPTVDARPDFPRLEEQILERWQRESTLG